MYNLMWNGTVYDYDNVQSCVCVYFLKGGGLSLCYDHEKQGP